MRRGGERKREVMGREGKEREAGTGEEGEGREMIGEGWMGKSDEKGGSEV